MVEHTAVNRGVVGSSPTRGAYFGAGYVMYPAFLNYIMLLINSYRFIYDVGVKTCAINLACITYYTYAYHDFWKKLRCS